MPRSRPSTGKPGNRATSPAAATDVRVPPAAGDGVTTTPTDLMLERINHHQLGVHILSLFLAVSVSACVPVYERRLERYRAGGDLAAAEQLLDSALEGHPDNPDVLRDSGIVAFEQGDLDQAIDRLARAHALDPDDGRTEVYLAAAYERSSRYAEAAVHYRHLEHRVVAGDGISDYEADLICRRSLVESQYVADLVATRLAEEKAGTLPPGDRLLILPFRLYQATPGAQSLRLGLASVLSADWRAAPSPEAVPFAEVEAFMTALEVPLDAVIGNDLRDRLARLTGARYVLDGTLSDVGEVISAAPVLIDLNARSAAGEDNASPREVHLEYQQARTGSLVEFEQTLLFHVTQALEIEFSPVDEAGMRRFSSQSGYAIALYGEGMALERAGDRAAAMEKLAQATALDPDFAAAREAQLRLTSCRGKAGEPESVLQAYEVALADARARSSERDLLARTTNEVGRVGGPAGDGDNFSINRAAGAGSAVFPVRLPR